jgi:hypothetical protein
MNQSENINELAAALAKAQGEMQAAIKDCINPFFKSKYADLGSVWDAARPVLCKNGLCIMQTTEMLGEKIVMVTMLAHTSGQWVKSYLPLNPSKNDSQGVGAAITYLRRYSLSALVGVVCDDDDDGETASGRGKTSPSQKQAAQVSNEKIETAEVIAISNLADKLDGESFKSFMGWIKVTFDAMSISDIPKNAVERCLNLINAKIKLVNDQNRVVA